MAYYAVTATGAKPFTTPFGAGAYLDKAKVPGTVEVDVEGGGRTVWWRRSPTGQWTSLLKEEE